MYIAQLSENSEPFCVN